MKDHWTWEDYRHFGHSRFSAASWLARDYWDDHRWVRVIGRILGVTLLLGGVGWLLVGAFLVWWYGGGGGTWGR